MSVKYLTRALSALRSVYRFPGQLMAPPGVELELPLQLVHDVGRIAENESAARVVTGSPIVIGAGNTTVRASIGPGGILATLLAARPGEFDWTLRDVDIWLVRLSALADTPANFGSANYGLVIGGFSFLLARWDTALGAPLVAGLDTPCLRGSTSSRAVPELDMPSRVPIDATIAFMASTGAGGAATITVIQEYVIVPRGVTPPKQ